MVNVYNSMSQLDKQALKFCMQNKNDFEFKEHFQFLGIKDYYDTIAPIRDVLNQIDKSISGVNYSDSLSVASAEDEFSDIFTEYFQRESKGNMTFSKLNPKTLIKDIKEISILDDTNIYIGKNTLITEVVTPAKRKKMQETGVSASLYSTGKKNKSDGYRITNSESNVFALKNIVIDIDCHYDLSPEEWIWLKSSFLNAYEELLEYIPTPTVIDFSGRGFHIWYNLNSASVQLAWLYRIIAHQICNNLQKAIDECVMSLKPYLDIDKPASKKVSGLIRMFGTPNPKASTETGVCIFNPIRYDLNELKDLLNIKFDKSKKINKQKMKKYNIQDGRHLASKRLYIIEQILEKKYKNIKSGYRHNLCFTYFNNAKQIYDFDKAVIKLREFNQKLLSPLSEAEIRAIIKCFRNKNGFYKLKNATFYERLGITEAELIKYKIEYKTKSTSVNSEAKLKKQARNKKILDVYFSCGSIKNTAEIIGVCENTIRKVIRQNSEKLDTLKRRQTAARNRRIFNNYLNTRNLNKAAKAGKCNIKTAAKIIKKYKDLNFGIYSMINRGLISIPPEIFEQKRKHHNVFYKSEYLTIEKIVSKITGLDKEDINIAIAPYLCLHG